MKSNSIKFAIQFIIVLPLLICAVISLFTFSSCGTDIYYALEPPSLISSPSSDPASRYFAFYTNDFKNNSLDVFTGTAIYYKIYTNQTDLNSEVASINSSNIEYSSVGMNRLLNYGYKAMTSSSSTADPFFSPETTNRKVRIRLFTEGSGSIYQAGFFINDAPISSGEPRRFDGSKAFNFSNTYLPQIDEVDVKGKTGDTMSEVYVTAYAVSVGRDQYLANLYSQLVYLGYVTINTKI